MFRRLRLAPLFLSQHLLADDSFSESECLIAALAVALFCVIVFGPISMVRGQTYDPWFNAGDVTFTFQRYYDFEKQSIVQADYVTDARYAFGVDTRYLPPPNTALVQNPPPNDPAANSGLPVIPPSPNQTGIPALTQPQSTPTTEPTPAPVPVPADAAQLPAPASDQTIPPPAPPAEQTAPIPPQPTDASATGTPPNPVADPAPANAPSHHEEGGVAVPSLSSEMKKAEADDKKKEEEKKKEKPAIPDLAKAILIAQNEGDLTWKPGVRIQPRYEYDGGNNNNDFFIRRFRLKGSGSAYGIAKYAVEMKIDNENRFAVQPNARAENAWLEFPVVDDYCYMRAGLYDLPFSRDALTSDSKILFMDRTLIKEQLTAVGMADNTFGILFHGRPDCGHFEYAFGIFDDDQFERLNINVDRESDQLMPAGRLVWSFWDPQKPPDGYADYMESYIGKGERLDLGINAAHLGGVHDNGVLLDITAWGVDLFANSGRWTFQTEYDQIIENVAFAQDNIADGWYAQVGYLLNCCSPITEFCVRHEFLDPLVGEDLSWWRIGFNFYIREHNLKVQTDYNIRSHDPLLAPLPGGLGFFDDNVFEVQLQLDF